VRSETPEQDGDREVRPEIGSIDVDTDETSASLPQRRGVATFRAIVLSRL
jgi:hypothetical protein